MRGLPGGAAESRLLKQHLSVSTVLSRVRFCLGSRRILAAAENWAPGKFLWKDACVQGCSGCASSSSDEEVLEGFACELSF